MFNNYKFKPYQLYFRHTAETYCVSTTFAKWQQLQQIIKNIGSLSLHFI